MKQDPEFFDDKNPELIYIAKRLKEALALEEVLTSEGIDYLVEPDRYRGGFIFQSERIGAFFYVDVDSVDAAKAVLVRKKYRPYVPD